MTPRQKRSVARNHRIEARLSDEEYRELEQIAYEEETTLSNILRRAIKAFSKARKR